ncbi:MAG: ABC transporter permease subunit [Ilumatobacteraceae bacterium]
MSVALLLGFPIGLLIGYRGGRLESAVMRLSDGLMAMPGLIIVIAVIGIIGNGLVPAMVALGLVLAPVVLRLTCGIALGLRNEPYVDSARVLRMRTRGWWAATSSRTSCRRWSSRPHSCSASPSSSRPG